MRINKEVETLSKKSSVIFLGVGNGQNCFVERYCENVYLINGKRNTILTQLRLILTFLRLLFRYEIKSIHIINEQLLIFFYPFLFTKHVVLDLFDSIFLRWNKSGNKWLLLKKIVYWPVNKIIVTDENRLNLMPGYIRKKCNILPNYPRFLDSEVRKKQDSSIRIMYNGWLGLNRGTEVAEGLLRMALPVKIIMAGWFSDKYSSELPSRYPNQIEYLGVVKQDEILKITAEYADYILCVYKPVNENNINASPNKVYDAIQTGTPVIINSEVRISRFVEENKIGIVIPAYAEINYPDLYKQMKEKQNSFIFNREMKQKYSWEKIENVLLSAHHCF